MAEQTELTVTTLFLLDQAGATLGDEIDVRAGADGVFVRVLVGDTPGKHRILEALDPIALQPGVQLDVKTVEEASRQRRRETPKVIAREVGPGQPTIRADEDLQRHFGGRLAGHGDTASRNRALQQQVTEFAASALGGARQALLHAWALEHLVDHVPPERVGLLDGSARAKWRSMVRQHSLAFLRATELLRLSVEPVFLSSAVEAGSATETPESSNDIASIIHRLRALAVAQDDAVRAAFTLRTDVADATLAVRTRQFWQQVRQAEMIAKRLAEVD